MLSAALRRHICDGPLKNLEQRLLNALSGNVPGNGRVLIFTADLVYFINVNNSVLASLDVAVGTLQQFQNDVLNVLSHITGFCEGCGIDNGKGDTEPLGQCLGQQRLSSARGPNQQNVALVQFDVAASLGKLDALVMVIDCYSQFLLCGFLADDILVQVGLDLVRLGQRMTLDVCLNNLIVIDNVVANADALITDENGRSCNELSNVVLALVAKGTAQRLFT